MNLFGSDKCVEFRTPTEYLPILVCSFNYMRSLLFHGRSFHYGHSRPTNRYTNHINNLIVWDMYDHLYTYPFHGWFLYLIASRILQRYTCVFGEYLRIASLCMDRGVVRVWLFFKRARSLTISCSKS